MNDLVLKIDDLSKTYMLGKRDVHCLCNLNLEIKRGELVESWVLPVLVKLHC